MTFGGLRGGFGANSLRTLRVTHKRRIGAGEE